MHVHEQWQFQYTSQWGWSMPLSEHVYCVAIAFYMTERVEQRLCIRFCVKLKHSSTEIIWMIQKATTMGNWWLAASSTTCPFIASHLVQSFFAKHQITQMTQPPYSLDLAPCDCWILPKLKSALKGKRFQTISETQENTMGQLMVIGRTVWGPKGPTLKGTEAYCPMYSVSCIFFNKCLYFSY